MKGDGSLEVRKSHLASHHVGTLMDTCMAGGLGASVDSCLGVP